MYLMMFFVFSLFPLTIVIRWALAIVPDQNLGRVIKDPNHTPTVAVLIPCFNEGSFVYDTIKAVWESDYPKDKLNIFPQDDGSQDDSYEWMLKASRDFDRVYPERNTVNNGKTITYLRALDRSESEIVINVDSDVLIEKNTLRLLIAPFADSRIGVVGSPAGVIAPGESWLNTLQMYLWFFGSRVSRIAESQFLSVAVVGGWALAVRRQILKDIEPYIHRRNWFGVPVKDGEDRFITHLALLQGWRTYIEHTAMVWTRPMPTYAKLFGQQLRWKRSMLRTFFWIICTMRYHIRTLPPMALFSVFTAGSVSFILFMGTILGILSDPISLIDPAQGLIWAATLLIVTIYCSVKFKNQPVHNPIKLLGFFGWWVVNLFFLTCLSLLTLDQDAWGNRDVPVKGTN